MKRRTPAIFTPSAEDIANMKRYRELSTEKKLQWLEQMRSLMIELWKQNPELRRQRRKLAHDGG